jgi:hypothetical protein
MFPIFQLKKAPILPNFRILRILWKIPIFSQIFCNLNLIFFPILWFQEFGEFLQISINLFQIVVKYKKTPNLQ